MLVAMGRAYQKQVRIKGAIVDFLVEGRIVEVHGCYWHRCEECGYDDPDNKRRKDEMRQNMLGDVTVIWSHELEDLESVAAKIFKL